MNLVSRNMVPTSFTKLRLQLLNSHSINIVSEKSALERLQLMNSHLSYSPFLKGVLLKSSLLYVLLSINACSIIFNLYWYYRICLQLIEQVCYAREFLFSCP